MKLIFNGLKQMKAKVAAYGLLLLLSSALQLLLPYIMSNIIQQGIKAQNMPFIYKQSAIMFILAAMSFLFTLFSLKIIARISAEFTAALRSKIYKHALNMELSDITKMGNGAMLTRSTSDIRRLADFLQNILNCFITVPILIIGGAILTFLRDPVLALIVLLCSPLVFIITFFIAKKMSPLIKRSNKYIDIQNTVVRERLSGIRVIRAFNREQHEHNRMAKATNIMADNIIKSNVFINTLAPIGMLILNFTTLLVLYVGKQRILDSTTLDVGDIVAVTQYISLIMTAILSSAWAISMYAGAKVSGGRINEILTCDQIKLVDNAASLSGSVLCRDVSYTYQDAELMALSEINIDIASGQTVAFIGGTGSGKSTLILALTGLIHTNGEIFFGEKSFKDLSVGDIRENVAVVFQKSDIFSGKLRDCLDPYGCKNDEELFSALSDAQLYDFVKEKGLDYTLNQGGSNLSGGQKQRLSIARALLRDASIYIFDDSFSALDYLTEQRLRKCLAVRLCGKTRIISTQRIATARNCDIIYVFDGGKILGCGTHSQLMNSCEIYKDIFYSQTGGRNGNK